MPSSSARADALFDPATPMQWLRVLLLDLGVSVLLLLPLMTMSVWMPRGADGQAPGGWLAVGFAAVVLAPGFWAVQSVRLGRRGQTFAMRRLGVWLVDAETGRPAGVIRTGFVRRALSLPYLIPGIGTLLMLVDAVVLMPGTGRPLLDRLTGTVMLRDPHGALPPRG